MKLKSKILLGLCFALFGVLVYGIAEGAAFSNFIGKQTARFYNEILLYNTSGTQVFSVNNSGTLTASNYNIVVDSFATTAATDSVTLGTGYSISSVPLVKQYTPAWSTEVDTALYTGDVVVTGEGLTKLVVTRVKTYKVGAAGVKSGAQYIAIIKK